MNRPPIAAGYWALALLVASTLVTAETPPPDMRGISADDLQMIEIACFSTLALGPAAQRECKRKQAAALRAAPPSPDMRGISADDLQTIEIACFSTLALGPAAQRECKRKQAAELRAYERRQAKP